MQSKKLMSMLFVGVLLIGFLGSVAVAEDVATVAIRNWDYDTIDPHVSAFTQSWWMINCFTDTLVSMGPDGGFYPLLASSWEAFEDGKVWVFYLAEGITFHDGTPWNADALIANFDRVRADETKSLWFVDKIRDIQTMEAVDDMTVRLTFDEPKPGFLITISQPGAGYISPTAFNNPANTKAEDKYVGTGPFILVEEIYQQRVTMVKNEDYSWAPSYMAHQGAPLIDELIWRFIPEDETRLAALLTGEVDIIAEVPSAEMTTLETDPGFGILFFNKPGVAQVYHLNAAKGPTDDLAVRQAMNYAVDQEKISQAIFQGARPAAYGLLMPASPYYNAEIEDMYAYNPDKAIEVLEAAGWVDPTGGGTGTRMKDGELCVVDFVTYPGFVAEAPAELVQAMVRKVGIQMNITVLTGGAMMEQAGMVESNFNSCVCGDSSVDTAMELYYFCHSDMIGVYNFAHYSTAEIDALIDEALSTTDMAVKEANCKAVQRIWMEEALCTPTVCATMVWGAASNLVDVTFTPDGTPVFYDASL
ncbi:ABC transporter substrate-binding protein [Candidatus Bipolaricaulota bacterium]